MDSEKSLLMRRNCIVFMLLLLFSSFSNKNNIKINEDGSIIKYINNDSIIFGDNFFILNGNKEYIRPELRDFFLYEYYPYIYFFSDLQGYREIFIEFESDTVFSVLCQASGVVIGLDYFNIEEKYKYHFKENMYNTIIIDSLLYSNRDSIDKRPILKPFEQDQHLSIRKYNKFPNLSKDTIFLSHDMQRLNVGYFTFEKYRRITPESEQKPVVLPQYLDSAIRNLDFQKFVIRKKE